MVIYVEDYYMNGSGDKKVMEIEAFTSLGELLAKFNYERYFALVNGEFKPHNHILNPGDVVTLLPDVSGG